MTPVGDGKTKAVVVVLSSFMDESPSKEEDMAKFSKTLKTFWSGRNELGFWWIDMRAVPDVQKCFQDAGLQKPRFKIMEDDPEPLRFDQ